MIFVFRSRRAVLGLAPAALLLAAMPSAQAADAADQTLLNATYDVGRELFCREIGRASCRERV